jgi:predicted amidohydrolase
LEVAGHDTDAIFVDACAPARAIENEIIHVFVNNAGRHGDITLPGQTQINIPFYGTVALVETNEEKLSIKDSGQDLVDLTEEIYRI